ncbi:alpha/beta-hydrolase [Peniophora sp. CONT]|nr:alpha/beta-hydrolase [Peniophora sp. CONT]
MDWYKELASLPTFAAAEFLPGQAISVTSSTQDFTRNTKRNAARTIFPLPDGSIASGPTLDVSSTVQLSYRSCSGDVKAIFRETGTGDSKKRYIEVWTGDALIASIEATEAHDAFYTDDFMGSISFSPSENSIVYLAEAKAPKATDDDPLAKFRYVPHLGEMLTDRKRPTIFVARWDVEGGEPSIYPLEFAEGVRAKLPHMISNARFFDERTLVAIGHELTPSGQLPSVRWCHNRPTQIYKLSLSSSRPEGSECEVLSVSGAELLSNPKKAARSPRVLKGKDGNHASVFWLEHERDGPHMSCSRLVHWREDGHSARTLVNYVSTPSTNEFKGLFVGWALLARPFVKFDGKTYIICAVNSGARTTVLLIDTEHTGDVFDITPADDALLSWNVLGTDERDRIVCVRSSLDKPQEVVLGTLSRTGKDDPEVTWSLLWKPVVPSHIRNALRDLKTSIVSLTYPVETILLDSVKTSSDSPRPLVSIIHGGPHGSSVTSFSTFEAALVLSGYTVSLPNYTGSNGYGGAHISALIGKCGTLDVQDCVDTVNKLVELGKASLGPGKHYIYGGSHGGFLGAHLVGQHPDLFSGAILSNPVITPLPSETDIPDWYFTEFLQDLPSAFAQSELAPALYEKLFPMTPIAHVQNVKARVRLLLGLDDHRVSNNHGMAFYGALKAQGKDVDILTFPGSAHGIDGVEETAVWVKAALEIFGHKSQ